MTRLNNPRAPSSASEALGGEVGFMSGSADEPANMDGAYLFPAFSENWTPAYKRMYGENAFSARELSLIANLIMQPDGVWQPDTFFFSESMQQHLDQRRRKGLSMSWTEAALAMKRMKIAARERTSGRLTEIRDIMLSEDNRIAGRHSTEEAEESAKLLDQVLSSDVFVKWPPEMGMSLRELVEKLVAQESIESTALPEHVNSHRPGIKLDSRDAAERVQIWKRALTFANEQYELKKRKDPDFRFMDVVSGAALHCGLGEANPRSISELFRQLEDVGRLTSPVRTVVEMCADLYDKNFARRFRTHAHRPRYGREELYADTVLGSTTVKSTDEQTHDPIDGFVSLPNLDALREADGRSLFLLQDNQNVRRALEEYAKAWRAWSRPAATTSTANDNARTLQQSFEQYSTELCQAFRRETKQYKLSIRSRSRVAARGAGDAGSEEILRQAEDLTKNAPGGNVEDFLAIGLVAVTTGIAMYRAATAEAGGLMNLLPWGGYSESVEYKFVSNAHGLAGLELDVPKGTLR